MPKWVLRFNSPEQRTRNAFVLDTRIPKTTVGHKEKGQGFRDRPRTFVHQSLKWWVWSVVTKYHGGQNLARDKAGRPPLLA